MTFNQPYLQLLFSPLWWKRTLIEIMASKPSSSGKRTNFSIFEIFFDLPHPAASSDPTPAKIVEPKESEHRQKYNLDTSELYTPQNISKITRFAFPEHDDRVHGKSGLTLTICCVHIWGYWFSCMCINPIVLVTSNRKSKWVDSLRLYFNI